jgi:hypothetical protein
MSKNGAGTICDFGCGQTDQASKDVASLIGCTIPVQKALR